MHELQKDFKRLNIQRESSLKNDETGLIVQYERARYVRNQQSGKKGRSYSHDLVRQGDVLQATLSMPLSRVLLLPDNDLNTSRYFFFVYEIMGICGSPDLFAATRRLTPCDGFPGYENVHRMSQDEVQFLPMKENVRRAGVFHICSSSTGCQVRLSSGSVKHGTDLGRGGISVVVGRDDGFPPHIG